MQDDITKGEAIKRTRRLTRDVRTLVSVLADVGRVERSYNAVDTDAQFAFMVTIDGVDFHVEVTGPPTDD
jgi:hypothetical protein